MTAINPLAAISPIDGRYQRQTESLSPYFSESGLIRYRLLVEVEYFIALCNIPLPGLENIPHKTFEALRALYRSFDIDQAEEVKEIEKETNDKLGMNDEKFHAPNEFFRLKSFELGQRAYCKILYRLGDQK